MMLPNHHLAKPVLIGEITEDGQFDIISQTAEVAGDAWTDFLPESAVLKSDWKYLGCGMNNTDAPIGEAGKKEFKNHKPNSGVRGVIATALVQFQLMDPALGRRMAGIRSIEHDPEAGHLEPLRGSIEGEADPRLKARKVRLERLLTLRFDADEAARVAAIGSLREIWGSTRRRR